MKPPLRIVLPILFITSFLSCSFFDDEAPIPSFLDLKNPTITFPNVGRETHNIVDVWVFQDGQVLGVFPLPAKVPFLSDKPTSTIKIVAGIRINGMVDQPTEYAFYEAITTEVAFKQGETVTIPLNFSSLNGIKIPINENFESAHDFSIDLDKNVESKIEIDPTTASLGSSSGLIKLSANASFVEVASTLNIPKSAVTGGKAFIEFDYKGEGEIAVGIAKLQGSIFKTEYLLFVPGKQEWNRIYVDLTASLNKKDFDSYQIVLSFQKPPFSISAAVNIDNFKHVHF